MGKLIRTTGKLILGVPIFIACIAFLLLAYIVTWVGEFGENKLRLAVR